MRKLNRFLLLAALGASAFLLEGCGSPVKTWAEYSKEMEAQGMEIPILNNLIFWPAGGVTVIAPLGKEV